MRKEPQESFDYLIEILKEAKRLEELGEEKFTVEEFRKYLESQDSLGDIHYYLNEANIRKANEVDPDAVFDDFSEDDED